MYYLDIRVNDKRNRFERPSQPVDFKRHDENKNLFLKTRVVLFLSFGGYVSLCVSRMSTSVKSVVQFKRFQFRFSQKRASRFVSICTFWRFRLPLADISDCDECVRVIRTSPLLESSLKLKVGRVSLNFLIFDRRS